MSGERGFSLMEMIVVVAVVGIMCALAVGVSASWLRQSRATSSTSEVLNILELGRNQATSQRRDFQLVFTAPNQIQLFRQEQPNGSTLVANRLLENELTFKRFTSLPDTPDAFGHTGAVAFGTTPTIRFTSDGSLIDSSGDVLNGTLFLATKDDVATAHAITIFGATGLIRTWRWSGSVWAN